MKKITLTASMFVFLVVNAFAQIPNSGFETWENYEDDYTHFIYEKPDFWVGSLPKNSARSFSISKINESYPASTGQFSMKIQADITNGVRGAAISSDAPDPMTNWIPKPTFAINNRPSSLYLYYKCFPAGGDTIIGMVYFYKNGNVIGNPSFGTTETVANWTALEIPMTYYTNDVPDSATIMFVTGAYVQHSESTLYIDNLSFNGFVTSVANNSNTNPMVTISPNPASDIITIQNENRNLTGVTLNIYNTMGALVQTKVLDDKQNQINIEDLTNGIYMVELKSLDWSSKQKLFIQR